MSLSRTTRVIGVWMAALIGTSANAAVETRDWHFDVFLDDRHIGTHSYQISGEGQDKRVQSVAEFDVKLLFITVFRYRHQAMERWQGNCLQEMQAQTEVNGDTSYLNLSSVAAGARVETQDGAQKLSGCVRSFAYWDLDLLRSERLLNSQTGIYESVSISDQGRARLDLGGTERYARHFQLNAESGRVDLWYSESSEWLALASTVSGGRRISYMRQETGDRL